MTVAKSHPVKEERLEDIRTGLGGNSDSHRLIFVTEARRIDTFQGFPSVTSISQYVTPLRRRIHRVLDKSNRNESSSRSSKSQKTSKKSV
jgi:hypothetical protein